MLGESLQNSMEENRYLALDFDFFAVPTSPAFPFSVLFLLLVPWVYFSFSSNPVFCDLVAFLSPPPPRSFVFGPMVLVFPSF